MLKFLMSFLRGAEKAFLARFSASLEIIGVFLGRKIITWLSTFGGGVKKALLTTGPGVTSARFWTESDKKVCFPGPAMILSATSF